MESTSAIVQKTTIVEEKTLSAANYAGLDTQLKTLNITGGTLTGTQGNAVTVYNTEDVEEILIIPSTIYARK